MGNKIIHNTKVLKSNLGDYNDSYILVRCDITVTFTKCIIKIEGTIIDDTQDLDLVMTMCNLIEYSSNYLETTGRLWLYSKDEATNFSAEIANDRIFLNLSSIGLNY